MYLGLVFSQLFSYTGIFQASCHISCREKKRVVIRSHDLHALKREITAIVLLKSKSLCGVFVVLRNFSFLPKIGEAFRESSRCGISSYSRCIPKLLWVISTVTSCTNQNDVMSSLCVEYYNTRPTQSFSIDFQFQNTQVGNSKKTLYQLNNMSLQRAGSRRMIRRATYFAPYLGCGLRDEELLPRMGVVSTASKNGADADVYSCRAEGKAPSNISL